MKKRSSSIILVLILIAGLSLLLYPTFSNWWNSSRQSYMIADYVESVSNLSEEEYNDILEKANNYNKALLGAYDLAGQGLPDYNAMLNLTSTGIMSYIDIPIIGVSLPIYHGTSDTVLEVGVGHIQGSSLPVGGENTHCVLSGHRGLPSARLFTDLDKLVVGDIFILHTLNETLTYEVDQIRIVEPSEVNDLMIEKDKDYCTLVTCTPYGVNTHRMLVRGHRVANASESYITSDAIQIEPNLVAIVIGVAILVVLLALMVKNSRSRTKLLKQKREFLKGGGPADEKKNSKKKDKGKRH